MHLSSAFHVSPFDETAVVSVDGFGDFASAEWGVGRGTDISINVRCIFPYVDGIAVDRRDAILDDRARRKSQLGREKIERAVRLCGTGVRRDDKQLPRRFRGSCPSLIPITKTAAAAVSVAGGRHRRTGSPSLAPRRFPSGIVARRIAHTVRSRWSSPALALTTMPWK